MTSPTASEGGAGLRQTARGPVAQPEWRRLAVIAGLTGFAISQPLLALFGDNPAVLAFHGISERELFLYAIVVALVPPVVLWLVGALVRPISPRVSLAVHLATVGVLAGLFAAQVAASAGVTSTALRVVVGAAAGVGFVVAYLRWAAVGTWAAFTAVLPFAAIAFFAFASPAASLRRTATVATPAAAANEDLPTVVWLLLDELPTRSLLDEDDEIDRVRYPNLAALADDGTWYRRHTTLAPITDAAVPSMLTGTLPRTDAPLWTEHPDNVFSLLAPTHELEVIESATKLCGFDTCAPTLADGSAAEVGPGFRDLLDLSVEVWAGRVSPPSDGTPALDDFAETMRASTPERTPPHLEEGTPTRDLSRKIYVEDDELRATVASVDTLVSSLDAGKSPAFYFLHLMLPHQPWRHYPDGELYGDQGYFGWLLPQADRERVLHSWNASVAALNEQRHILQLQFTDRLVGLVLDALRAEGLYDDSLVVVSSDHGASFEHRTHARHLEPSTVDAIAYAPLLIKAPGQQDGEIDDSNVLSIDIVPTLADQLGLTPGWDLDGVVAGSPGVAERGTAKTIYDIAWFGEVVERGVLEFDDAETPVHARDRWVGPLVDPDDPLSGLPDRQALAGVLGRPLDDLRPRPPDGTVEVHSIDVLREPPSDMTPLGVVTGRVETEVPDDSYVILAVDGVVVTGAAPATSSDGLQGWFAMLLPQGTLDDHNEIRAALITPTEVRELDVR